MRKDKRDGINKMKRKRDSRQKSIDEKRGMRQKRETSWFEQ